MRLERVVAFLESLPDATSSGGDNMQVRCPFCGGSTKDVHSLSIKIEVGKREPMVYRCFRMSCGESGILNTETLQLMGCSDVETLLELSRHNAGIGPRIETPFSERRDRGYAVVNLPVVHNSRKLEYVRRRLGVNLSYHQLGELKIQLGLMEMLRINEIRRLSVSPARARLLDENCVGFVSMFSDYLICRDITPDLVTGNRYYGYRLSGTADPTDLKIYSIPRTIDIMDPRSAVINVAEGPFSILGAYLNTDLGAERPNNLWLANCGSEYRGTIIRVCKQYGLLRCRINIWSDSEVKVGKYRRLLESLDNRLDIRRFRVYYNASADDFGHPRNEIKPESISLK